MKPQPQPPPSPFPQPQGCLWPPHGPPSVPPDKNSNHLFGRAAYKSVELTSLLESNLKHSV
jgi:hypothetical protein